MKVRHALAAAALAAIPAACTDTAEVQPDEPSIDAMALDAAWDTLTESEQDDVCIGYDLFGPKGTYAIFVDGLDDPPSMATFVAHFEEVC